MECRRCKRSKVDRLKDVDVRRQGVEPPEHDQKRKRQRRKREDGDAQPDQHDGDRDAGDEGDPHADIGPVRVKEDRQRKRNQTRIETRKSRREDGSPFSEQHTARRRHDPGDQQVGKGDGRRDQNGRQKEHARQFVGLEAKLRAPPQDQPPVGRRPGLHRRKDEVDGLSHRHAPAVWRLVSRQGTRLVLRIAGQSAWAGPAPPSAPQSDSRRLSTLSDLHVQPTIPCCATSAFSVISLNSGK